MNYEEIAREIEDKHFGRSQERVLAIAEALRTTASKSEKDGWNKAVEAVLLELAPFNNHTIDEELWRIRRLIREEK